VPLMSVPKTDSEPALMTVVALATGAKWPRSLAEVGHIAVVAWLVHGLYLGGVFVALAGGMSAGISAMLVGLQPILTVLIARGWLGEPVLPRQWLGLVLGLAGGAGLGALEESLGPDDLRTADEAFLTSTLKGILPIRRCDGWPIRHGRPGPITRRVMDLFHERVQVETKTGSAPGSILR